MIITCNNCDKKFDADASVIPERGRLLQCSNCNHKWFFKKKIINKTTEQVNIDNPIQKINTIKVNIPKDFGNIEEKIVTVDHESSETMALLDRSIKKDFVKEKTQIKNKSKKWLSYKKEPFNQDTNLMEKKANYSILSLIVVFIISFIALIIVMDTFQKPISNIVPNIEFLLYNLYESINDIVLFIEDLI